MSLHDQLFAMQDIPYRDFQSKLIPDCPPERVIGIRTPVLRKFAKEWGKTEEAQTFLSALPHEYFEENQLHAFLIAELRDFDTALRETDRFLPYVNNWATCDQLRPKAFAKQPEKLLPSIAEWLNAEHPYTIRFAVGMLMTHFLDARFQPVYAENVAAIESREYYVNMMRAWYFATALAKQYDAILPFLLENRLDRWTHNKTIQKACESYRITADQKAQLRQLKR